MCNLGTSRSHRSLSIRSIFRNAGKNVGRPLWHNRNRCPSHCWEWNWPKLREALGPGQPPFRAKQIYTALYRRRVDDLGPGFHAARRPAPGIERIAPRGPARDCTAYESADRTRRYLLRLDDGRTVETVLMPEEGRDTVCISSQVGCPVDCKFCMTALMVSNAISPRARLWGRCCWWRATTACWKTARASTS